MSSSGAAENDHNHNTTTSARRQSPALLEASILSSSFSYECWDETVRGIANVLAHLRGTWYSNSNSNSNNDTSQPISSSTDGSYGRERQLLEKKYVTPVKYGAGAALFLFVNFRITGSPRFQAWRQNWVAQSWGQQRRQKQPQQQPHHHHHHHHHHQQQQQQQLAVGREPPFLARPRKNTSNSTSISSRSKQNYDSASHHMNNKHHHHHHPPPPHPVVGVGYLEAKREREIQAAMQSMRLLTDILVSVSVGISGTLWLLQAHQHSMRRDFEEAPLVAGRSVVVEQMCGPFLEIDAKAAIAITNAKDKKRTRALLIDNHHNNKNYHDDNDDDDDGDHDDDDNPNDPNMVTFTKFIINCQLRRDFETRVRTEQGLSKDEPVSIPDPGLARSYK